MNLDQARELDLYILDSSKACLSRNMVQGISITLRCSKPFKRKSTHLEMATCKVPAQNFNASYLRLELSTRDLRYLRLRGYYMTLKLLQSTGMSAIYMRQEHSRDIVGDNRLTVGIHGLVRF